MARVGEPRLRHTRVGGSARQVVGGWVAREPMHSSKEWSSMIFLCVCVCMGVVCSGSSARCPLSCARVVAVFLSDWSYFVVV